MICTCGKIFFPIGRVYPVKDHSVFLEIFGAISYLCAVSIIELARLGKPE